MPRKFKKGAIALNKHLNTSTINLNHIRAQNLNAKCVQRAQDLASEYQLSFGGHLSFFRIDALNILKSDFPARIKVGRKLNSAPLSYFPSFNIIRQTIEKSLAIDSTNRVTSYGILENNRVYILSFENYGDSPAKIGAFLAAMAEFFVRNDSGLIAA